MQVAEGLVLAFPLYSPLLQAVAAGWLLFSDTQGPPSLPWLPPLVFQAPHSARAPLHSG